MKLTIHIQNLKANDILVARRNCSNRKIRPASRPASARTPSCSRTPACRASHWPCCASRTSSGRRRWQTGPGAGGAWGLFSSPQHTPATGIIIHLTSTFRRNKTIILSKLGLGRTIGIDYVLYCGQRAFLAGVEPGEDLHELPCVLLLCRGRPRRVVRG